jgi:hypothetical protein
LLLRGDLVNDTSILGGIDGNSLLLLGAGVSREIRASGTRYLGQVKMKMKMKRDWRI